MQLDETLYDQFKTNGYILIPSLFDSAEVDALQAFAKEDRKIVDSSYVRKDATGGDTRLSLQNDFQEFLKRLPASRIDSRTDSVRVHLDPMVAAHP